MQCCVPNCKNNSRSASQCVGITYHDLPTEPTLCESWLRALSKQKWNPEPNSVVCSDHFAPEDMCLTIGGHRRVKSGAMPRAQQLEETIEEPINTKYAILVDICRVHVCHVCLATNTRLYTLTDYKLNELYEELTGILLPSKDLTVQLCPLCITRLTNHARFRDCARAARRLLTDVLSQQHELASQSMKSAEQTLAQLPPFTIHHKQQYDLDIVHKDTKSPSLADVKVKINRQIVANANAEMYLELEPLKSFRQIKEENDGPQLFDEGDSERDAVVLDQDVTPPPNAKEERSKTGDDDFLNENDDSCFSAIDNTLDSSEDERKKPPEKKRRVKTAKNIPKKSRTKTDGGKTVSKKYFDPTLFSITKLRLEDHMDVIEKRKQSNKFINAPHKCTVCFKGFAEKVTYERHMFRHSDQCGEFECIVCKHRFRRRQALKRHSELHSERYDCKSCSFTTLARISARRHQDWHNGKRYHCTQCPATFDKTSSHLSHVRIYHPSNIACHLCGYSLLNEKGLWKHLKLIHLVDKVQLPTEGPRCEECDKIFASEEALSTHRGVQHEKTLRNAPPQEKDSTGVRRNRKLPKMDKKDEISLLTCDQCGETFQSTQGYRGHMRAEHGKEVFDNHSQCHVCGKLFQSRASARYHMDVHDESVTYPCPECGKKCKTVTNLYYHRRTHDTAYRVACPLCPRTFSHIGNRDRHVNFTHKTVKDVPCEFCPKKFKSIADQRQHQLYTHQNKPWPKRVRNRKVK